MPQSLLMSSLAILVASYLSALTLLSAQADSSCPPHNPDVDSRMDLMWLSKNSTEQGYITLHYHQDSQADAWAVVFTLFFPVASRLMSHIWNVG